MSRKPGELKPRPRVKLTTKPRADFIVSAALPDAERINGFCLANHLTRSKLVIEGALREIERLEMEAAAA